MTQAYQPIAGPRLSALIVTFNTGQFAVSCARSLRREWHAAGGAPGQLEIIVVDNNSTSGQRVWLETLEHEGAKVLVQPANLGYAGALQAAFEASKGEDDDYVALVNADVVFLPGSVKEMIRHLEAHPQVGAVGPRAFVDEERSLALPPLALPGAVSEVGALVARISTLYARRRAQRESTRARRWWEAEIPHRASMLSGACLFLPRAVAGSLECLMDRRYPLFFEDADLCRRLAARGLVLELHPRAHVLHHGARSTGAGTEIEGEPRRRWEIARGAYLERWCSRFGRAVIGLLEALVARWPERRLDRPIHTLTRVMPKAGGLELRLPRPGEWRFELATGPAFAPVAGCDAEVEAETWRFPAAAWEWLLPGRYYVRALDPESGRVAAAWTFQKTVPARSDAVHVEVDHHPEVREDWISDISGVVKEKLDGTGWRQVS